MAHLEGRFTGKERDAETGLDYFLARYYSGAQGRFTSPDPKSFSSATISNPQKWNRYAYVLNNPLVLIDPDGFEEKRSSSHLFNFLSDASQILNVRLAAGPGVKRSFTVMGRGGDAGISAMVALRLPILSPQSASVGLTAEAGGKMGVGPIGVKAQLKGELTMVKNGEPGIGLENKSGLGLERSGSKGNTGSGDLTVVGVGTMIGAVGPVPIAGEASINVNSDKLQDARSEFSGAVQEFKDTITTVLNTAIDVIAPRMLPKPPRRPDHQ